MYLREPPSKRQRIEAGWDHPGEDEWGRPMRKEGWARPEQPGWGRRPEEADWNRRPGRGPRMENFRGGYGPERRGFGMRPRESWRPRDIGTFPRGVPRERPRPREIDARPDRPQRPPQKPFKENRQLLNGNYRGALQEHLQREEGRPVNIIFNTSKMDHGGEDQIFTSRCVVRGVPGEGYGASRKEAVQLAALDVILKMELATEKEIQEAKNAPIDDRNDGSGKEEPPDLKDLPPIINNQSYLNGNYRGALQEYFQKAKIRAQLTFHTRDEMSGDAKVFITTCKASSGKFEDGVGHASTKKAAVHFSSLDFMLKIGLLTMEEHLEKHPD